MRYDESRIQESVVLYVRAKYPKVLLTSSPSSAARSPQQGLRLKKSGHLAGTPDLMIFFAAKGFYGLFIELKTETGKLSVAQSEFLFLANNAGYKAVCCYGRDQAIKTIDEYLN